MSKCYLCDEDAQALRDRLEAATDLLMRALRADGPTSTETAHDVRVAINAFTAQNEVVK